MKDELEKFTRRTIECWNRSEWQAYRALTAAGFVYEEAGTGRRVEDVEDVLTGWRRLKAAFPDATAEITRVDMRDDMALASVVWRATQTGPLRTAVGVEAPSFKRVQAWDVISMQWRQERLLVERHQLGLLSLLAPLIDNVEMPAAHVRPALESGDLRRLRQSRR